MGLLSWLWSPTPSPKENHKHLWGKWEEWGYLHQERRCQECGWYQLRDKEQT